MRGADECVAVQIGIVDGLNEQPRKMAVMASTCSVTSRGTEAVRSPRVPGPADCGRPHPPN